MTLSPRKGKYMFLMIYGLECWAIKKLHAQNMHPKNEWTPKELEEAAIEDQLRTGCDDVGTCNGGQICVS